MAVLEVKGLHKSYKKGFIPTINHVLKGVNFKIQPSTITGFLGGNGAGKTTTMKCLLGLNFPDAGEIKFFEGLPLTSEVKSRIGFLPERPYFYDYLTGTEFLRFYGQISLKKMPRKMLEDRIAELLKRVDLYHAKDRALRDYSKGMLQKIGLAQSLIHEPELVILDEPQSGLDPDGRHALSEIIKEVAAMGTSVFLSSHLLHDVERICENLVILKDGRVVYEGPTNQLLENVNQGTEIVYSSNGHKQSLKTNTVEEAQGQIDQLREQSAAILEVKPLRPTLEEAFVNIALQGDKKL